VFADYHRGMKRINSKTSQPFKRGDRRDDGLVFSCYRLKTVLDSGFYKEDWVTPEELKIDREKRAQSELRTRKIRHNVSYKKAAKRRKNKATGKPYRIGFKNPKTGKVFLGYVLNEIKLNGFYVERWVSSEQYSNYKKRKAERRREYLSEASIETRLAISIARTKKRAQSKNQEFSLSLDYLLSIYPKDGKCPVLGIEMELGGERDNSPTLDRFNNLKGYIEGNVSWISYRANAVKSDASADEILKLAEWIKKNN